MNPALRPSTLNPTGASPVTYLHDIPSLSGKHEAHTVYVYIKTYLPPSVAVKAGCENPVGGFSFLALTAVMKSVRYFTLFALNWGTVTGKICEGFNFHCVN